MKDVLTRMATLASIGAGALAVLGGGGYALLYVLFDGLNTSKVAALVLGMCASGVGVGLGVFWIVSRLWDTKHAPQRQNAAPAAIEADYWATAPAQLAAPRQVFNIPIVDRGRRGQPAAIVNTSAVADDGRRVDLNVDTDTLTKIIAAWPLPPTRANCGVSSNMQHSAGLQYLRAHGFVRPGQKGAAAAWSDGITGEEMAEWLREWTRG